MQNCREHKNFVCKIVLDYSASMMEPFSALKSMSKWLDYPHYNDLGLPIYEFALEGQIRKLVIPDFNDDNAKVISSLLSEYLLKGKDIYGGLTFIDIDSGELITTNWDLGETEEWRDIFEDLLRNGSVLHTFSATDAVIEVKQNFNDIYVQNLSWEGGLEESRQTNLLHVFVEKGKVFTEIKNCLYWFEKLKEVAENIEQGEIRNQLMRVISVKERVRKSDHL